MIDYGFEDRLVERIAVRQAVAAARLSPRQRRVLNRLYYYGDTLREVGQHERISPERVRQVCIKAQREVRAKLVARDRPQPTTRATPPPSFDKREFLRHMQGLIKQRAREAQQTFERERDILARMLEREKPAPEPPPSAWEEFQAHWKQFHLAHPHWVAEQAAKHRAEQEERERQKALALEAVRRERVSPERLQSLANEALGHLMLWRQPMTEGLPTVGESYSNVTFASATGQLAIAVEKLVTQIPYEARLSACEWRQASLHPPCAFASNRFAAVRVTAVNDGGDYRIDVTWTPCWT